MEVILSTQTLSAMLQDAAELGATAALSKYGLLRPYLSKQEAYRLYRRCLVERWIKERLVTPIKDGHASAKWRLSRIELEALAKASNRPSYRSVRQR